jgi:hypothetical protein
MFMRQPTTRHFVTADRLEREPDPLFRSRKEMLVLSARGSHTAELSTVDVAGATVDATRPGAAVESSDASTAVCAASGALGTAAGVDADRESYRASTAP